MTYPTWSDLDNESIVPPHGARKGHELGSVAVMVSCKPDLKLIKSKIANTEVSPFFTSSLMIIEEGRACITGPFIGAPYAAMLLESLIAKGVDKIIFIGWCGSMTDKLNIGDIILPYKTIVDEGTSANYKILDKKTPVSIPDLKLMDKLSRHLRSSGNDFKKTTIWTTDAIYRETKKKIAYYKELGAHAVEMECSALFSVAQFRKVSIAGVLVVSDSVASKDWDPGFRNKRFKQARKTACDCVMTFAQKLCEPKIV